jgi:hypothetical protein
MSHKDHHYSVTVHSDDLAVINCLRSLADFSQKAGNKRIAWGGTTDKAWKEAGNAVTFRFTDPKFRQCLLDEARRLLPTDLWNVISQSDNDPATPQAK